MSATIYHFHDHARKINARLHKRASAQDAAETIDLAAEREQRARAKDTITIGELFNICAKAFADGWRESQDERSARNAAYDDANRRHWECELRKRNFGLRWVDYDKVKEDHPTATLDEVWKMAAAIEVEAKARGGVSRDTFTRYARNEMFADPGVLSNREIASIVLSKEPIPDPRGWLERFENRYLGWLLPGPPAGAYADHKPVHDIAFGL
jgi:hypothetical protein